MPCICLTPFITVPPINQVFALRLFRVCVGVLEGGEGEEGQRGRVGGGQRGKVRLLDEAPKDVN